MHSLPKKTLLAIALLQGLFLYALYYAFDEKLWPSQSPMWSFPLWTLGLAIPLLLLLSLTESNGRRVVRDVAIIAIGFAALATYTGFQAEPFGEFTVSNLGWTYALTMTLAAFKALMYMQQRADQEALTYPVLFTNSWRNFLVGVLSAIFVFVFFWILMLWGQLFKSIEIKFFYTLFQKEWFLFPTLSVAFGVGVIMFRDLTQVIDTITRLLHWLCKLLLPLVIAVAAIFILALPFVGLSTLWATGSGTALLLWLLALTLFFVNAVYQDGRETKPYPRFVHRMIYAGLCIMPILSALSFYGLYLRLAQYGWTVERCWAFVTWLVLSLFAVGYVIGIIRRRSDWTLDLARVNVHMGWIVLALMLLANSPLLDFRKISLSSQLARVESGEVEVKDFDFWYTKRHLVRPGYLAMQRIKEEVGESDPELVALIDDPIYTPNRGSAVDFDTFWNDLTMRPADFKVPAPLRIAVNNQKNVFYSDTFTLVQVDLDDDGMNEYVLVGMSEDSFTQAMLFYLVEDVWKQTYLSNVTNVDPNDIANGEITLEPPRFNNLKLGDTIFKTQN